MIRNTMRHHVRRPSFALVGLIGILFTACGNPAAGPQPGTDAMTDPQKKDSTAHLASADTFLSTDSSFSGYLEFFSEVHALASWPKEAQAILVRNGAFWATDKSDRDFILKYSYRRLDPILYRHIPTQEVRKLAPPEAQIAQPLSRYTFYAFAKEKRGRYWLCSMLGVKREMEQVVYGHNPFLLATYREDGALIDEFIWWCIVDDDIQVYDDVDVAGDTLLVGWKNRESDSELSEVYARVVIDGDGRFREVFSAWPEGYLRE